jgi:hypothetical protein
LKLERPVKIKSAFFAAFGLCLLATGASAQQGGTEQEKAACSPDVKKLCTAVIDQGDLAILGCLQQNRAKISKACNQVLVDHGQ